MATEAPLLSGLTFIRNATKYDFPIVECIRSMLSIVDELVVNVGDSDDDTEAKVRSIGSSKIRIVRSRWDDQKTQDGTVLSEQTNIGLDACRGRWVLYLQADEALHEDELPRIRAAVEAEDKASSPVDAFRFRYLHFYGGYEFVQRSWRWYPSEIRLIRRSSGLRSFGDAQTFRFADASEARAVRTLDAHVFHYGHAREPEKMKEKIRYFHRFWHGENHGIETAHAYAINTRDLVPYWGSHPRVYEERVRLADRWSVGPRRFLHPEIDRVLVFGEPGDGTLARELREKRPGIDVFHARTLWQWLAFMLRQAGKRHRTGLVDLLAEQRSLLEFLFWVFDAVLGFRWRVAVAPKGTLSKFRRRFYCAVVWMSHEEPEKGFRVPEQQLNSQILKWF